MAFVLLGASSAVGAGPLQRLPNTTLQFPTNPPSTGFTFTNAFPGVSFTNPVAIASPPGETNRLFVAEKNGLIVVITNLAAPTRTVFIDLRSRVRFVTNDTVIDEEEGLLGLTFHPGFATNGYFYVFYTGGPSPNRYDILSQLQVSGSDPNQGNTTSETRFIVQPDEAFNHNGGDLHFGPDGYLYVALGDEGGSWGQYTNTQRIDKDFFSAIMRLDVDKRPGSLAPNPHPALPSLTNYAIPPDNYWVGATNFNNVAVNPAKVRTEFYSVGMRNPWRFTFDDVSGLCYVGHVGQDAVEWINIITNGANCGWNYYEGSTKWSNNLPAGFVLTPPLAQYGHTGTRKCIIGGVVYRGMKMSQLYGSYLYSDFVSGEFWALKNTGYNVTANSVIFSDPNSFPLTFGVDPSNGDPLYAVALQGTNSQIRRIIYNTTTNGSPVPATLAATGAFTNLTSLSSALDPLYAAPGIVPYGINVPFWSDNAIKSRWFSIPNTNLTIAFHPTNLWSFPTGSVWIKHFNLLLTNGVAASARRIETRFLIKNTAGIYGLVYRWGGSPTNAALVSEAGLDESFVIDDGGGVLRTQMWHYPSRIECNICHTPQSGYALGFRTEQLNCDWNYNGVVTNQLSAISQAGYFSPVLTNSPASLLALASATNTSYSLEYRARSYLAANCVSCHQPGASSQAAWDARITTPTMSAGLLKAVPFDTLGNSANRIIMPSSPTNSVLLTRICTRDLGAAFSIQMPPVASNLIDTQNIALITAWIQSLANTPAITNFTVISNKVALSGASGFYNGAYNLLGYSNVAAPLVSWPTQQTGTFDPYGNFSVTNNRISSDQMMYYLLQVPGVQ